MLYDIQENKLTALAYSETLAWVHFCLLNVFVLFPIRIKTRSFWNEHSVMKYRSSYPGLSISLKSQTFFPMERFPIFVTFTVVSKFWTEKNQIFKLDGSVQKRLKLIALMHSTSFQKVICWWCFSKFLRKVQTNIRLSSLLMTWCCILIASCFFPTNWWAMSLSNGISRSHCRRLGVVSLRSFWCIHF